MINKQNLWFLTLFSLVLVLGVYYVTMPNELLLNEKSEKIDEHKKDKDNAKIKSKELTTLEAMRETTTEERDEVIATLQESLTNEKTTTEEKNNAYEQIKSLNAMQGMEEKLEKKLKEKYSLDCFVKTDEQSNCQVVCISSKHDNILANNIMRSIQEEYDKKLYITVKFQKK